MKFVQGSARRSQLVVFAVLVLVGLGWALYTQHAWEDYYITYRASKNLATGQGLTFAAGERVHSFTSPLGVLLPALASLMTGNRSDVAALWIFRAMSIAALAGAGVVLWNLAARLRFPRTSSLLLIALFATEGKIVDFSTNGMETGFLLLFLCWTLYALITKPASLAIHLGLAWAGLMWTRPDSFVYIGALGMGTFWFLPAPESRRSLLQTYARAAGLTTLLYAPWLLWAWSYYGTPVPHTILAKGLFGSPASWRMLLEAIASLPQQGHVLHDLFTSTFMPAYSLHANWPAWGLVGSLAISLFAALAWLLPWVTPAGRIASFGFLVGSLYLANCVGFPVPWYLPSIATLGLLVVGSVCAQLMSTGSKIRQTAAQIGAGLLVVGFSIMFCLSAYQLRLQQRIIEDGNRTEIGRWLKSAAPSPQETVFLEPLGYIGFYSGLKMLDYPGLCSTEMIEARQRASSHSYPFCWSELITDLLPDWLVLRPHEEAMIRGRAPTLLDELYVHARTFDVQAKVDAVAFLPGRGYLDNDARFEVYHRKPNLTRNGGPGRIVGLKRLAADDLALNDSPGHPAYFSGVNLVANAPSHVAFSKPAGARWFVGGFGLFPGAYENPRQATDGAEFVITWIAHDGTRQELLRRTLRPRDVQADRKEQSFNLTLPPAERGTIELIVSPGPNGNDAFDWSYWSALAFETQHGKPPSGAGR